jgi:hypothetical protein
MGYNATINSITPTCIVFLLDQSASMSGEFGVTGLTKARGAVDAINRHIAELVLKCARGDGVRDYFHIAVIGYGSDVGSASFLIGDGFVKISWLTSHVLKIEEREVRQSDGSGQYFNVRAKYPIWFEPQAYSDTPMCAALGLAIDLVEKWVKTNEQSFPPIVINITDGESTDGDPRDFANRLRSLSTIDGNVLFLNCHISGEKKAPILFPSNENDLPFNRLARELFQMSSELPKYMFDNIAKDILVKRGARGFSFNADLPNMFGFIEIGTKMPSKNVT